MSFLIRFSPTLNIQKLPDFLTKHTLHTIMFYVILLYICICSPHLIIISNLAVNFFSVIQPATKKIRHPLRPPNNAWFRWMNLHCIQKISIPVCVCDVGDKNSLQVRQIYTAKEYCNHPQKVNENDENYHPPSGLLGIGSI